MQLRPRKPPLLAVIGLLLGLSGCLDQAVGIVGFEDRCGENYISSEFTKPSIQEVDLLFVIDNSYSMYAEQMLLQAQFELLIIELQELGYRLPDMHIGVVSTDLGTDPYTLESCEILGGDQAVMNNQGCVGNLRDNYIINVQPVGCVITRDETARGCVWHECDASHCAHEPSTELELDSNGCPRCVNYMSGNLAGIFRCVSDVGYGGCGFEQPLEAMKKALDNHPMNQGFLRENSFLAVVLLTDEDDCSSGDGAILFDPEDSDNYSAMGPLSSWRCFEFGVACEPADASRMELGTRYNCQPREDPDSLLYPLSRYIDFLSGLRPNGRLAVAAIAGPYDHGPQETEIDLYGYPSLAASCGEEVIDGAIPGIRLRNFIEAFNSEADLEWAYTSVCNDTYVEALQGIGREIRNALDARCPTQPLVSCSDPGARYGEPVDQEACNDSCLATCMVTDLLHRGTPQETTEEVPPCLEVCPYGPCPDNHDASQAYAGGTPPLRDEGLPVRACWYVAHNRACDLANGAEVRVSRQADPGEEFFIQVACAVHPTIEGCCADGLDDDGDCLVDTDDPDCAGYEP